MIIVSDKPQSWARILPQKHHADMAQKNTATERNRQTVDPLSHCGDVVKSFAKQHFHGFNRCLKITTFYCDV